MLCNRNSAVFILNPGLSVIELHKYKVHLF
jgi:hypothetical protein